MGFLSFGCKAIAFVVAAVAVLIGLAMSGALKATGVFQWMDGYEGARGTFFKGMFPVHHIGTPWGFTHEEMQALDLKGNTILVTGANVGLGYWTAHHLAAQGATVLVGCRSQAKCDAAVAEIKKETGSTTVHPTIVDLGSFASIRKCAASLQSKYPQLDSLILNAGIMIPPFRKTEQGLESQIGTNHFGHFLLTDLLLPQVEAAAKAKGVATIVPVSSAAHYDSYAEGILPSIEAMNDESTYSRPKAYGQSKLANVLFGQELAERVKGKNILVNSIHPGGVKTKLGRHMLDALSTVSDSLANFVDELAGSFSWHPRDAALTQLFAAVGPSLKEKKTTGLYYHPIARVTQPDPHARGEHGKALRKHLWTLTEDFIAKH